MKFSQLPLILWTKATLILLLISFSTLISAQSKSHADHNHIGHNCDDICYITPDSMVKMDVILPFDSEFTTMTVGVKDGLVFYQGDIILGTYNELLAQSTSQNKGSGTNGGRWTNSTVRYYINGNFSNSQRNQIIQAANEIENKTDLCFVRLNAPSGNYVNVVQGGGCSSYIGMIGGAQALTLSGSCGLSAMIHEFLHAAGMNHEQTRSDRDQYVVIYWQNIIPGMEPNFQKAVNATNYGNYDYNSIMHYRSYAFSKNGQPTLLKTNGGTIPYISNMSSTDIGTINAMYSTCGGGGGGGGNTCQAPTATQNSTTTITQNTARLHCSANYTYRQWRHRHTSSGSWITSNYTTNLSYINITNLAAANTYVWQSRVWCGTQWSPWSVNETFTTQSGGNSCTTPTAAQNTTSGITNTSASLNCTANYTYKQYRHRPTNGSVWTTTNYTINSNTKAINGLSAGTDHYWQSRVWCGSVWGAWSSNETFSTTGGGGGGGGGACGAASGLYYYGLTSNSVTLDWNDASGSTSYLAYYWNGTQWTSFATIYNSYINVTNLQSGNNYCFLIGNFCNGVLGGYSNYVCVATPFTGGNTGTQMADINPVELGLPHSGIETVSLDVADAVLIPETNPIPGEEQDNMLDIQLAPNPVTQNSPIVLEVNAATSAINVTIININGSTVFQNDYTLEPGSNQLRLAPLAHAGMYFVTVQSDNQLTTAKLMVID